MYLTVMQVKSLIDPGESALRALADTDHARW
jgi:hypothetical protein